MADDPTLATNPLRVKRMDECDGAIADWIGAHTHDEVLERFRAYDVVAGPICDIQQLFADPHVQARPTFVELKDPALGKVRVQDVVPRFAKNPARMRWLGKRDVGADTDSVLTSLGYSDDEISALEAAGVVKRCG